MRFARGTTDHRLAVANSRVLFAAAARAGVRRIVHVSIANLEDRPSDPYYAGKGEVERALRAAGPSWAILRPAVLFGDEPILVNSIAWLLRHLPVFLIPGDGRYGIQPAHVEDLADLAVAAAAGDGQHGPGRRRPGDLHLRGAAAADPARDGEPGRCCFTRRRPSPCWRRNRCHRSWATC